MQRKTARPNGAEDGSIAVVDATRAEDVLDSPLHINVKASRILSKAAACRRKQRRLIYLRLTYRDERLAGGRVNTVHA